MELMVNMINLIKEKNLGLMIKEISMVNMINLINMIILIISKNTKILKNSRNMTSTLNMTSMKNMTIIINTKNTIHMRLTIISKRMGFTKTTDIKRKNIKKIITRIIARTLINLLTKKESTLIKTHPIAAQVIKRPIILIIQHLYMGKTKDKPSF